MRSVHRSLVLLTLLALALAPAPARAQIVFGNFAPGTSITPPSGIPVVLEYNAVSFTVGPTPITLVSLDLALESQTLVSGGAGLTVQITTTDLPDTSSVVGSFTTSQDITSTAADISFLPSGTINLASGTTYYLQLVPSFVMNWDNVNDSPQTFSDYSSYLVPYATYFANPNTDQGGYYLTATAVPEAAQSALLMGSVCLVAGLVVRRQRKRA